MSSISDPTKLHETVPSSDRPGSPVERWSWESPRSAPKIAIQQFCHPEAGGNKSAVDLSSPLPQTAKNHVCFECY